MLFSYYAYVISSIKSVTRAEWDLPETDGGKGREGGEEMTQTMCAHVNK
jgi:hypothetical protein